VTISDRLKGLLDWWELRIETERNKTNEDTKENVERINTPTTSDTSSSVGNDTMGRGR
jgi:hypothetical protein